MDSKTNKLLAKNLDSGIITQIISLPLDSNISINRPVVSGEYVVWSETSHRYLSAQPGTYELRAFDLKKHSIKTVAHLRRPEPNHAVADHRVVWDDSGLHMADLNTGAISVLETFGAYAPAIKDNTVVWSARDGDSLNLWGLNLADRKPVPLVIGDGDQIGAVISGDRLVWQNEGGGNNKLITYTSLSEAFTTAPDRAKQLGSLESLNPAISSQSPLTDNPEVPGYTNPRVKGMHAANGDGWNGGTAAINALGANQTTPYFGSVLVLDTDLYRSTGYSGAPWGPEVRHAAKTLVETYGVRVIFRTVPTLVMTTTGSVNPEQVAQQVLNHAWRYWLRDIQINNEPNEEWPFSCTGCKYTYDNATYTYNFNGQFDSARLHAIGDFYWDSRLTINNYKTTHPDPNVRYNLTNNIDIWTPPMAAYYTLLSGNNNMYDVLNPMIQQYPCTTPGTTTKKCFSYHTYPTPNGYGPYGTGIRNNAWDWFSASLKTSTDNGQVRSQITEFGWDPGQLGICGYTQNSRWRGQYDPGNPDPCDAKNGQDHYFENDINLFISTYLHGAETINVWLVRGWSNASDGLDANGIAKRWLINYQNR
jgi:hypothetical protein